MVLPVVRSMPLQMTSLNRRQVRAALTPKFGGQLAIEPDHELVGLRRFQIGIDAVEVHARPRVLGIDAGPREQLAELARIDDVVPVQIGRVVNQDRQRGRGEVLHGARSELAAEQPVAATQQRPA